MLNPIEVSGSTYSIPKPKAKTDNLRPLAWMVLLFLGGLYGLAYGTNGLKKFQPPSNQVINQFFLSEGTHHWVLRSNEQCEGYIVGGWKKRQKIGERIWYTFKIPQQPGLSGQQGQLKGTFGDYRNLEALEGNLNGQPISFDGTRWIGVPLSTKDLVLMVDGPDRTRLIKLPSPWNREFDSFLKGYINEKRSLVEVDKDEFRKCVKELAND